MIDKEPAPRVETKVYELNGVTYLPHYKNPSIFVAPGYPRGRGAPDMKHAFTEHRMLNEGARPKTMFLWSRVVEGELTN